MPDAMDATFDLPKIFKRKRECPRLNEIEGIERRAATVSAENQNFPQRTRRCYSADPARSKYPKHQVEAAPHAEEPYTPIEETVGELTVYVYI